MFVYLSGILFCDFDHGFHSFLLLQQLQAWSVWIRDLPQPVGAVVIDRIYLFGQQGLRTASEDRDLQDGEAEPVQSDKRKVKYIVKENCFSSFFLGVVDKSQ